MADPTFEPIIQKKQRKKNDVGVYCFTFPDGSFYIGSSVVLRERHMRHMGSMRSGRHENIRMQRRWNKFGSVAYKIALICREEDLLIYEQLLMDQLRPTLNISPVAGRVEWTQESREKLSNAVRGRKHTPEARARMSAAQKGRKKGAKQSEETCRKRSLSMKGKQNGLGTKRSEEAKLQTSKFMKGNKFSVGRKGGEVQKAAVRLANLGNKRTFGLKQSEEAKAKIGAAAREMWARLRAEGRTTQNPLTGAKISETLKKKYAERRNNGAQPCLI